MSKELTEISKRLRAERCPGHVTESVFSHIREDKPHVWLKWGFVTAGAFVVLLILSAVMLPSSDPERQVASADPELERAREELNTAMIYFGRHLNTTRQESGEILADSSLTSLGKGLLKMYETLSVTSKNNG